MTDIELMHSLISCRERCDVRDVRALDAMIGVVGAEVLRTREVVLKNGNLVPRSYHESIGLPVLGPSVSQAR